MAIVRLMKFILKNLYIILVVAMLCIIAAFFAYDNAYLNIVVRDGMTARAECILYDTTQDATVYKLHNLFSTNYVYNVYDTETVRFDNYTATNYRYSVTVGIAWVWPWSKECSVTVEEQVLELMLNYTGGDKETNEMKDNRPKWINGDYKVNCVKKNGVWKIDSVELIKAMEPDTTPTPKPSLTPLPSATPNA